MQSRALFDICLIKQYSSRKDEKGSHRFKFTKICRHFIFFSIQKRHHPDFERISYLIERVKLNAKFKSFERSKLCCSPALRGPNVSLASDGMRFPSMVSVSYSHDFYPASWELLARDERENCDVTVAQQQQNWGNSQRDVERENVLLHSTVV